MSCNSMEKDDCTLNQSINQSINYQLPKPSSLLASRGDFFNQVVGGGIFHPETQNLKLEIPYLLATRNHIAKKHYHNIFIATMASAGSVSIATREIEETLARIRSHKGVEGILIMTREGKGQMFGTVELSLLNC